MGSSSKGGHGSESWVRLAAMVLVGAAAGTVSAILGLSEHSIVIGWAAACIVYVSWVWLKIGRMSAERTAIHATREDPARGVSDVLVILASLGSLGAILFVVVQGHSQNGAGRGALAALAVISVVLSWFLVHTLYTLRYARLYYTDVDGGVEFNQKEPPRYSDFAYLAFTLGMTFQVSDTNIGDTAIRSTALRHALLSYLFGSVILATTINLVVGLAS